MADNILSIIMFGALGVLEWFKIEPSIFVIVRNSLIYSRKTGIQTAMGNAMATIIHIIWSIVAFSLISKVWDFSFETIQILSVIYLTGVGMRTILSREIMTKKIEGEKEHIKELTKTEAIRMGFLTGLFNPKYAVFFMSVFFAIRKVEFPWWVLFISFIILPAIYFLMGSVWAKLFSQKWAISFYQKHEDVVRKILGIIIILVGLVSVFLY
ncbi:MAG: LysE family transporter [Candidatus Magasanikiibacteriota bacterium]